LKKPFIVIEDNTTEGFKTEDGGHAQILTINDGDDFFIRLHSWCEKGTKHPIMDKIRKAKHIRITVEAI